MWVFLSRRLRVWVLATVALPVLGWALGRLGRGLEQRRGQTRTSRLLIGAGERARRRSR